MRSPAFADDDEVVVVVEEVEEEALVLSDASAAPSTHNAQPWRFRYRRAAETIELRADFERAMPYSDPQLRALHLGCGAALFNLRVAAQNAGLRPVVRPLPDPDDPRTLASVRLAGAAPTRSTTTWTGCTQRSPTGAPAATRSPRSRYPTRCATG